MGASDCVYVDPQALADILRGYTEAAQSEPPVEPCGFLVGQRAPEDRTWHVIRALPAENRHATPDRAFLLAAEDHLEAKRQAASEKATLLGFWHGHLVGPPHPGSADRDGMTVAQAVSPGDADRPELMLIVGRGSGRSPIVHAYRCVDGETRQITLRA